VVESFVATLDLDGITMMVQDWGGPIGLSVAVRHPERFRALVIGNTFGWSLKGEKTFERFSKLRSRVPIHVLPREIMAAQPLLSEVEQGLGRLAHLPALIVWGDRAQAFKEPQLRRWEQTFPNHRTVVLHGASHYIQEDAPEEIIAAITDWWPGQPANQQSASRFGRLREHS